jgi:hypothetical protein
MTPEQALILLSNATAQMSLTRLQHHEIAQALAILKALVDSAKASAVPVL